MSNVLLPRPEDRPPQREDWGTGVAISIVAHLALVGALAWGIRWNVDNEAEGVTAELWAAVPQAAAPAATSPPPPAETPPALAPRPPAPPPPAVAAPTPPDIVTEKLQDKQRQREKQLEQAKDDKARLDQAKAEKAEKVEKAAKADKAKADAAKQQAQQKQQLDAQTLAKLHDENVKRMMGQMDTSNPSAANGTGAAERSAGPSAGYAGRIKARIRPNLHVAPTDTIDGEPTTEVEVRCGSDGTIIGRRITHSSGSKAWDDAVIRAIDLTAILPRDTDGRVPSPIVITFNHADTPG